MGFSHALKASLSLLALAGLATGCSSNLTRFDMISKNLTSVIKTSGGYFATRGETAVQGGAVSQGFAASPNGTFSTISKVTIGGSYSRFVAGITGGTGGPNSAGDAISPGADYPAGPSSLDGTHTFTVQRLSGGLHGNMRATK